MGLATRRVGTRGSPPSRSLRRTVVSGTGFRGDSARVRGRPLELRGGLDQTPRSIRFEKVDGDRAEFTKLAAHRIPDLQEDRICATYGRGWGTAASKRRCSAKGRARAVAAERPRGHARPVGLT